PPPPYTLPLHDALPIFNSLLAGDHGVPVAFVAGDTAVCNEAKRVLGDGLATYAVKDGIDMFAASCLHPEVTEKGIREGVASALRSEEHTSELQSPYDLV